MEKPREFSQHTPVALEGPPILHAGKPSSILLFFFFVFVFIAGFLFGLRTSSQSVAFNKLMGHEIDNLAD